MKEQQRFAKIIDVIYQEEYPNNFEAVLRGDAFWFAPIEILGYFGKFWLLNEYREVDMNHPKCWTCGRFKKRNRNCELCN